MPHVATLTRVARRTFDVLLIVQILLVLAAVVLARVLPAATGGATFVVGGGSMEQTIPRGSAVVALPVAPADLAVGDVVSVHAGTAHAVFTHRIVRIVQQPDGLWISTRGDANDHADPSLVPARDVIGRVALSVPWAGYLIALLSSIRGVAFLAGIAALLLSAAWLLESLEEEQLERLRRSRLPGAGIGADAAPDPGPAG